MHGPKTLMEGWLQKQKDLKSTEPTHDVFVASMGRCGVEWLPGFEKAFAGAQKICNTVLTSFGCPTYIRRHAPSGAGQPASLRALYFRKGPVVNSLPFQDGKMDFFGRSVVRTAPVLCRFDLMSWRCGFGGLFEN